MSLVLASASPRRAELLRNAAIQFTVDPAHVAEQTAAHEVPVDYAQRLANDKARAVFARHPQSAVLGADTVVVVDQHLLEKPDRKSTRLNSSHLGISYAVFCLKKKPSCNRPCPRPRLTRDHVVVHALSRGD